MNVRLFSLFVIAVITFTCTFSYTNASMSTQIDSGSESWGYVDVRKNAHIFWWLYRSNSTAADVPLIIWQQGGPGASSTGFGNFAEIGPLDENLDPRNTTWLNFAHLLFIDNPVGSGFSYVDDPSGYTTNITGIADDFLTVITSIYKNYPEFEKSPLYIFCESYGGKMTAAYGVTLLNAIKSQGLPINFQGVALGDSWIDGQAYTQTWGPYLLYTAQVDPFEFAALQNDSLAIDAAISANQWDQATNLWGSMEDDVESFTDNVDFYNVLLHNQADPSLLFANKLPETSSYHKLSSSMQRAYERHVGRYYRSPKLGADLDSLMNGPIRKKLQIIPASVTWGGQSGDVFNYQSTDFMRPVVDYVDQLLAADFPVTIFNGQLDLICDTVGTELWMSKLQWPGLQSFLQSTKTPLYLEQDGQNTQGFFKNFENLSFYYINNAGHMVASDNPYLAAIMAQTVTGVKSTPVVARQ
jgi:serine carboxypeptidase 1